MKSVIAWAIHRTPAMNVFMAAILIVGLFSGYMLRREEFPRFELEIILVTVPYPGASPEEVEQGICQKVEEAVRSVDGIKKITSIALEGSGSIVIEVKTDVPSVQKVLAEVESEIDRIPSFPDLTEEPEIRQLTIRNPAIRVGVVCSANDAANAERRLRDATEKVRDDLLTIPEISVANIQGERNYQIDVEIPEATLRQYGLTLTEVAQRIRFRNLELPGGNIRDDSQEYLLRGKNKRLTGEEIADIPLITARNGVVLTVGDLGVVRDEFEDASSVSRINGQPGMAITIEAAAREDIIAMTQAVRDYVATHQMPPGFELVTWGDASVDVQERLELLQRNGLQGLVLVFFVLALFLEFRLSFWVALGIPISVLGACAVLWQLDQTLNMLSMFAFLIALGIIVDDAIVIGENIYSHREQGKNYFQAAVDGTVEVVPSVATSITTTVFAFMPMFFVTGVMGKFFAVLPLAIIAMLIISLFESTLILPCHLAHHVGGQTLTSWAIGIRRRSNNPLVRSLFAPPLIVWAFLSDQVLYPIRWLARLTGLGNRATASGLDWIIQRTYLPVLRFCLRRPAICGSVAVATLLASCTLVTSGAVPWIIFPKLDSRQINSQIVFPDGTPEHVTDRATRQIEQAIFAVNQEFKDRGEPLVKLTHRLVGQVSNQSPGGPSQLTSGSHAGVVNVELVDSTQRSLTSQQIVDRWRAACGPIAGVESLTFGSESHGPGGTPIEFKLLAPADSMTELEQAVEACKDKLREYPGVYDITDDSRPGKWEIQLQIKDDARALGVPLDSVARTVRAAYYGEEVMRLQRGRHEVKLMVRYPEEERRSLARFDEIRVAGADGIKRPITELAKVDIQRGYSEINRIDQRRSITVTANVDEATANASQIVGELKASFVPGLLAEHPMLRVRWEGQQEQSVESIQSLFLGFVVALLAMYCLLSLEFRSYIQPAVVMAVIPFGVIGAIWGHAILGLPLTLFSVLGLVALSGVVVNDSIVLVDFINHRLTDGIPLESALLDAGQRRFRPVLLTSLTTIVGLLPILTERSFQAQLLIPMATSLCFGLLFSTALVLVLVPTMYLAYGRTLQMLSAPLLDEDEPEQPRRSAAKPASDSQNGNGAPAHAPDQREAVPSN